MATMDVSIEHVILSEKYSKAYNYKFLNIKVALLRILYCNSALFRRKTNVWLVEITVYKNSKVLGNNTFPIYIMIKIIFRIWTEYYLKKKYSIKPPIIEIFMCFCLCYI